MSPPSPRETHYRHTMRDWVWSRASAVGFEAIYTDTLGDYEQAAFADQLGQGLLSSAAGRRDPPSWTIASTPERVSHPDGDVRFLTEIGYGFPLIALCCQSWELNTSTNTVTTNCIDVGSRTRERFFPTDIHWLGMSANTLIFGSALFLTVNARRFFLRRGRAKRNLCIACGYPIGQSVTCPECGCVVRSDGNKDSGDVTQTDGSG